MSGATKYYSHYNQWCCLHWMLCGSTHLQQKPAAAFYDVLRQISNDFQRSFYCFQCRQTLAVAARRVRCRVLRIYREKPKQPWLPIAGLPLLEFSPALKNWSDIYTGPTSCLIVSQKFSSFVICLPSLSFCRSARLFAERSLLHIMSRHAPYSWLATSLFWYSARLWKITYPTF